jgi:hypothetical protein
VDFHRAHADRELVGNQLVRQPLDHEPHHVALAVGQLGDALGQPAAQALHFQRLQRRIQRMLDAVDQRVVRERLLAEIEGAALHRVDSRRHVGMAGQEDHRHRRQQAALHQPVEQHQPAGAGHAHVQQQAQRLLGQRALVEELLERLGAAEVLAGQAPRAQQPGQRLAHAGVVVHDKDQAIDQRLHAMRSSGSWVV